MITLEIRSSTNVFENDPSAATNVVKAQYLLDDLQSDPTSALYKSNLTSRIDPTVLLALEPTG